MDTQLHNSVCVSFSSFLLIKLIEARLEKAWRAKGPSGLDTTDLFHSGGKEKSLPLEGLLDYHISCSEVCQNLFS